MCFQTAHVKTVLLRVQNTCAQSPVRHISIVNVLLASPRCTVLLSHQRDWLSLSVGFELRVTGSRVKEDSHDSAQSHVVRVFRHVCMWDYCAERKQSEACSSASVYVNTRQDADLVYSTHQIVAKADK